MFTIGRRRADVGRGFVGGLGLAVAVSIAGASCGVDAGLASPAPADAASLDVDGCPVRCMGACCGAAEECAPDPGSRCCARQPGVDLPDDLFADTNCDGIDGDRGQAVFVDPQYGDDAGDGSQARPVRSLDTALALGEKLHHRQILVAAGDLAAVHGALVLPPRIAGSDYGIYGGYDAAFRRSELIPRPTLLAPAPAVVARDLTASVTWDRVDVKAQAASRPGGSSVAFRVSGGAAFLTLRRSRLSAGDGAAGDGGRPAPDATDGNPGLAPSGGCGCNLQAGCAANCAGCAPPAAMKPPGCPQGGAFAGGGGGDCAGGAGERGAGPTGGCGGATCPGGKPSGGAGGDGGQGAPGTGGGALGVIGALDYQVAHGGDGGDGIGGSGGGGGSGTVYGTCNPMACVNLRMSSPGPSGGSGGCGGAHGGGGAGGGGSFGVVVLGSRPRLESLVIVTGRGGDGGAGGSGSAGRAGGVGGTNGNVSGGPGGRGGDGGGGGGGGGGPSLCVGLGAGGVPLVDQVDCKPGAPGRGGAGGGGPIPGAPGADGIAGPGT